MPANGFTNANRVMPCYAQRLAIVVFFVLMPLYPVRLYNRVTKIVAVTFDEELFVSFAGASLFRKASVAELVIVNCPQPQHLYLPILDVDSIRYREFFVDVTSYSYVGMCRASLIFRACQGEGGCLFVI